MILMEERQRLHFSSLRYIFQKCVYKYLLICLHIEVVFLKIYTISVCFQPKVQISEVETGDEDVPCRLLVKSSVQYRSSSQSSVE